MTRFRFDGNPKRVRFALRPPTRRLLPARFPLRGLRDLHLPNRTRSLPRALALGLAKSSRALAPGLAAAAAAASPWAKPAFADAIRLASEGQCAA
jgi:hypothetical protein